MTGRIFTVAGTSWPGPGDIATARDLEDPAGLAALPDGGFLMSAGNRVWRVAPSGRITAIAGRSRWGFAGDGGPATSARLDGPSDLALLPDGGFLVSDAYNHRVRRVSADGVMTTVAGNGERGSSGDGGPAVAAALEIPGALAPLPDGGFLVADEGGNRVRRVAADGTISTVAGNGDWSAGGDGGPATAAGLSPSGLLVQADGGFLLADSANGSIRRVGPDGVISTFARMNLPGPMSAAPDGSILVVGNGRVLRMTADGRVTRAAGGGSRLGDGGLAVDAELGYSNAVAAMSDGGFLVGTSGAVRRVFGTGVPDLALAARGGVVASARGYRARLLLTRRAELTVRLYASRHSRAAVQATAVRGPGPATVDAFARHALHPGVYAVEIIARADGAVARSVEWAYVGGRLTTQAVRRFSGSEPKFVRAADASEESSATLCRRLSARRFDCVWVSYWTDEPEPEPGDVSDCGSVGAYLLRPSGVVATRWYRCPKRPGEALFKPRPRWGKGGGQVSLRDVWR